MSVHPLAPWSSLDPNAAGVWLLYEGLWLKVSAWELAVCSQGVSRKMSVCEGNGKGESRYKLVLERALGFRLFVRGLWQELGLAVWVKVERRENQGQGNIRYYLVFLSGRYHSKDVFNLSNGSMECINLSALPMLSSNCLFLLFRNILPPLLHRFLSSLWRRCSPEVIWVESH